MTEPDTGSGPDPGQQGLFGSIRSALGTGLALVQNRVELLGVELKESKARLVRVLVLTGALIVAGNMAAIVVTATIVVLAGESAREPALIGLSIFYLVASVGLFLAVRKELRAPQPFESTVAELKKDLEWLKSRK